MPPERDVLQAGAHALGVALDDAQAEKLLAYQALLTKWNQVYNLTAIRKSESMLTHHLLDSLSILPALNAHRRSRPIRLLDVGSGAGLPGLVIAALLPEVDVTCVDTVGKKASFIRQAAGELKITNLSAAHARVEDLRLKPFDVITSRAFASLADFTRLTGSLLASDGVWMAMKGKLPQDEIDALPGTLDVFHVEHLSVPGLDAERCLVWIRPTPTTKD